LVDRTLRKEKPSQTVVTSKASMALNSSLPLDNSFIQTRSSVTVTNNTVTNNAIGQPKRKAEQSVTTAANRPKKEPLSPEKLFTEPEDNKPLSPVPIDLSLKSGKPTSDIYTTWKDHVKEFLYNDDNSSNSLLSILSGKDKENCSANNTSMDLSQSKKSKTVRFAQSPADKPSDKKRKAELVQSPAPHLQASKRLGLATGNNDMFEI
jgi:hypothetical protein